jgi:hypothetical protein
MPGQYLKMDGRAPLRIAHQKVEILMHKIHPEQRGTGRLLDAKYKNRCCLKPCSKMSNFLH